jgi:hypothetical protein
MRGGWNELNPAAKVVAVVLVLLILWFLWPTPYAYTGDGQSRRNRITGTVEYWRGGRWTKYDNPFPGLGP